MNNFELAERIMELLSGDDHTAYVRHLPGNTQVCSVFVIDNDERRSHCILVDFAIAPRVGNTHLDDAMNQRCNSCERGDS